MVYALYYVCKVSKVLEHLMCIEIYVHTNFSTNIRKKKMH